jgi:oligosaccharyltransferase complex subunit delta (ribophorin II)
LPVQLLTSPDSLEASLIVGSFGSTAATVTTVFDVHVSRDPNAPSPAYETPIRYGKQPEIHHIFRADPKSPPKVISSFFVLVIMATVPVLFASVRFVITLYTC